MSVTNVMTDVWRKRALDKRDLFPATFWIRVAVAVVFGLVLLVQMLRGVPVVIRDGGLLFGLVPTRARADLLHLPGARRRPHHHRDVALLPRAADLAALDVHSVPGLHAGLPDSEHVHHSGAEAASPSNCWAWC